MTHYATSPMPDPRPGDIVIAPASEDWPQPDPLPDLLPPVPEFDPVLLPDAIRPWIEDVSERIQCSIEYPAVAVIVALGAVVGRQLAVRPKRHDDWAVVPNLWGAIIGRPGLFKTPALQEALRPLFRLENRAHEEYTAKLADYQSEAVIREAKKSLTKNKLKKAIQEGRDPAFVRAMIADETTAPARRRYVTHDATVEKLGELLEANPRGILVFRDELVGWLHSLDREGQECSGAFFLEAWAGNGRFTFDRIGRGTVDIEAATVSVLGGIQPGPLSEYVAGTVRGGVSDDGLLQRFQVTVWPDVTGEWRDVDRFPNSTARNTAFDAFQRLDDLVPEAIGAVRDGEPDSIPFLRLADSALEVFREWRERLERRLRAGDELPAFEACLAKYRSLVPSLALLFHLVDTRAGGAVGEAAMLQAIAWAEFLEGHARRLYSSALNPALAAARELGRHLACGDLPDPFTAREVYRHHWRLLDAERTRAALEYLGALGRVRHEVRETDGRTGEVWLLNPALKRRVK